MVVVPVVVVKVSWTVASCVATCQSVAGADESLPPNLLTETLVDVGSVAVI